MVKYYTRACNFKYGSIARKLIKKKLALPLCGNRNISFDQIELIKRNKNKVSNKFVHYKELNDLSNNQKKKVKKDLKNITSKRNNFLKNVNFSKPSVMGILNLTPDSFSDGGKFNKKQKSIKHISEMISSGADIIDVGGESTRPGSKTINPKKEWERVKHVIRIFKKRYKNISLSIDTRKSDLMVESIKYGANLINDVSGFSFDKYSLEKIKKFNLPKVLHHMKGTPNTMQKNPKYKMYYLIFMIILKKVLMRDLQIKKSSSIPE